MYIDAGTFVLNGGGLKAGTIFIGSGGTFQITKSYTGSNALSETIIDNGSLIVKTTATLAGNISGTGSIVMPNKGVLEFGSLITNASFTGTIVGLTPKNSIDLAALTYVAGKTTASYSGGANDVLTVTNGSQIAYLHLSGDFTNATWVVSKDATGGTVVVDPPAPSPADSQTTTYTYQTIDPPGSTYTIAQSINDTDRLSASTMTAVGDHTAFSTTTASTQHSLVTQLTSIRWDKSLGSTTPLASAD